MTQQMTAEDAAAHLLHIARTDNFLTCESFLPIITAQRAQAASEERGRIKGLVEALMQDAKANIMSPQHASSVIGTLYRCLQAIEGGQAVE